MIACAECNRLIAAIGRVCDDVTTIEILKAFAGLSVEATAALDADDIAYWRNRAVPADCPHEWLTNFNVKNQRPETQCIRCGYAMEAPAGPIKAYVVRLDGYDGNACTRCSNFTLRRSGTCMVCGTCGETTGCS